MPRINRKSVKDGKRRGLMSASDVREMLCTKQRDQAALPPM
jgi:hypothetical protein